MAYLLKIDQWEKSYDVGIFKNEQSIHDFIERIPFVKKEVSEDSYIDYFMKFEDIPNYYELNYNNYLYIFEKTGYLIKMNLILDNAQVFKLSEAIDKISFMGNGKFYYGDKILDLL